MFDYKKEFKEFYKPNNIPSIIDIPKMNFLIVKGSGDPGEVDGEYIKGIQLLYGVAYILKMSYKGEYVIDDFFQYVVPPLEGFWWQEGIKGYDSTKKHLFKFISMIRLPEFISQKDVEWAIDTISKKKNMDYSDVKFETIEEGLVVQCLHIGPFDDEPRTTTIMNEYLMTEGYQLDFSDSRFHHEIYLSDPRRVDSSKLKTILRHPIKKRV